MSTPQISTIHAPRSTPAPVAETGLVHIAPGLLGKTSRLRLLMFWVVGLMAFLAVILVVLHLGSLQKMAALIRSARPGWMLVALVVQSGTYVSAAFVWRVALRQAGHPLALRTLIPLGIAKVFTDQVLPGGGISGTMLVVRGLTGRRVPAGMEAALAATLLLRALTFWLPMLPGIWLARLEIRRY
jgi:glycosyltransferase 2 family protein